MFIQTLRFSLNYIKVYQNTKETVRQSKKSLIKYYITFEVDEQIYLLKYTFTLSIQQIKLNQVDYFSTILDNKFLIIFILFLGLFS